MVESTYSGKRNHGFCLREFMLRIPGLRHKLTSKPFRHAFKVQVTHFLSFYIQGYDKLQVLFN